MTNEITKLNHSLRYLSDYSEDVEVDLYDTLEDSYGKSCPVCDKEYLEIEWEPLPLLKGEVKVYIEYVYCPSCLSIVVQQGGEIIYNGLNKTWNEGYSVIKRSCCG